MLKLSLFLVLTVNTFACFGQMAANRKLIIRDVEYIHQSGTNNSASLKFFFKDAENRDTILKIINVLLSGKGYTDIEEKEANISDKTRSIAISRVPKFKPTLRQKLDITRGNWITTTDFIYIIQTGLTSLFTNKGGIDFIYPKQFTVTQSQQLNQHFAGYKIVPFDPSAHLFQVKGNNGESWKINPTKEKYTYIDKNIGGDMGSGILTGVLGIGTTATRKILFEDIINTYNSATSEAITVKLFVGGERRKEKESTKNSDGSRSVESSFTFLKKPDLASYGTMFINGDSTALFTYVPMTEIQNAQQKTSALDTLLFAQELKIEADGKAISDEVITNTNYIIKGIWQESSFAIYNRFSGNLTQYFWKDELAAFSLQNDYEPTLYILKEYQAPLAKMLLLQYILSINLFTVQ